MLAVILHASNCLLRSFILFILLTRDSKNGVCNASCLTYTHTHTSTQTEWILRHQQLIADYISVGTVVLVMESSMSVCVYACHWDSVCLHLCVYNWYGYGGDTFPNPFLICAYGVMKSMHFLYFYYFCFCYQGSKHDAIIGHLGHYVRRVLGPLISRYRSYNNYVYLLLLPKCCQSLFTFIQAVLINKHMYVKG